MPSESSNCSKPTSSKLQQIDLWTDIEGDVAPAASPSMRFCILGSGSTGNACVVQARLAHHTTTLLIDCGLGLRVLQSRLKTAGLAVTDLSAIFITHEHSDHVGALPQVLSHHPLPVLASAGTLRALRLGKQAKAFQALQQFDAQALKDGDTHAIGPLNLHPFTVPHDASEPLQLVLSHQDKRMGYVTDLGHPSMRVIQALQNLHAIVLEANHDPHMLESGGYPPFLKRRVAGALGHLTNTQSAQLLAQIQHPGLHTVVAAHLSLKNNHPDLAIAALSPVLNQDQSNQTRQALHWAAANAPSAWFNV